MRQDDSERPPDSFVSRAGRKLVHALDTFAIDPSGWTCADFGSHAGGFVDCLLRRGAAKVYAVERGYGVLDFSLRRDPRVVVLERTDARQVRLPEPVRLVTIDAGWTRQAEIIASARRALGPGGEIVSLIKPNYESEGSQIEGGVLPDGLIPAVLESVRDLLVKREFVILGETESPIRGHAGNREFLFHFRPDA